jgi:hypothetical protein
MLCLLSEIIYESDRVLFVSFVRKGGFALQVAVAGFTVLWTMFSLLGGATTIFIAHILRPTFLVLLRTFVSKGLMNLDQAAEAAMEQVSVPKHEKSKSVKRPKRANSNSVKKGDCPYGRSGPY